MSHPDDQDPDAEGPELTNQAAEPVDISDAIVGADSVHEPGTFVPVIQKVSDPDTIKMLREMMDPNRQLKLTSHEAPDLVETYGVFQEAVGRNDFRTVYHPCCATDVSPSAAFPNSRVIYADKEKRAMDVLKADCYEAHEVDVREFHPGAEVDVLILLNPGISPDSVTGMVAPEGFVLCNDYHATASELRENPDFTLIGMIRGAKGGKFFDDKDLEDYWREIESDEEWQKAECGFTTEAYTTAARYVETVTGRTTNILDEYRKLVATAGAQLLAALEPIDAEMAQSESTDHGPLILEHDGKQIFLKTLLPRKKGYVDNFFVYKRITS